MRKEKVLNKIDPLFLKGVCHRGLHDTESIENSLSAFKKAKDAGLPLELDVHLTLDGELVVIHDSETKRVTGKEGVIEDLTLSEIKNNYRLLNGEEIPTLKEVIELIDEKIPMVIELKPNTKNKNYKILARRVEEELKNVKDKKKFIFISFYPQCLLPLKRTKIVRCLLVCDDQKKAIIFRRPFEGVDLDHTLFRYEKFANLHKKIFVMSWTIRNKDELENAKKYSDSITFEHLPVELFK